MESWKLLACDSPSATPAAGLGRSGASWGRTGLRGFLCVFVKVGMCALAHIGSLTSSAGLQESVVSAGDVFTLQCVF